MQGPQLEPAGASILSFRVPFAVRKRRGRKLVITLDGETQPSRLRIDSALIEALARAHRRQRMLESGECASITSPPKQRRSTAPKCVACSG